MKLFAILATTLATASTGALAQTAPPTQNIEMGWKTAAELGAITTSGNTAGTSITGKIDSRQETEDWSNEFVFTGFFKEDEIDQGDGTRQKERSAERFAVSAKGAYRLTTPGNKLYMLASHVNDKFGAYLRYSTVGIGHSTNIFQTANKKLDFEIGPGYFRGTNSEEHEESGLIVRGAAVFNWRVSDTATFQQNVSVEKGTSNTHSVAESSLSTKIVSTMQLKAAFQARNDTNVADDKKKTDLQTSLTLVYSF